MGRYYIEEVQSGFTDGGIACGPVGGNTVVSLKVKDEGRDFFLTLIETMGFANFYLSTLDIFDKCIEEDFDDDIFFEYLQDSYIDEFAGIRLYGEYDELFKELENNESNPAVKLIRYMILLTEGIEEDTNVYTETGLYKFISDVDVPYPESEEEYNS